MKKMIPFMLLSMLTLSIAHYACISHTSEETLSPNEAPSNVCASTERLTTAQLQPKPAAKVISALVLDKQSVDPKTEQVINLRRLVRSLNNNSTVIDSATKKHLKVYLKDGNERQKRYAKKALSLALKKNVLL